MKLPDSAKTISCIPGAVERMGCLRWRDLPGVGRLKWAIIFFVISLITGLFGFTNIATGARGISKALFFVAR